LREAWFESGHHHGRVAALRLAEQQMHVLGHHYIAHNYEVKPPSDLLQDLEKEITITIPVSSEVEKLSGMCPV
jgi:hypothetical protein